MSRVIAAPGAELTPTDERLISGKALDGYEKNGYGEYMYDLTYDKGELGLLLPVSMLTGFVGSVTSLVLSSPIPFMALMGATAIGGIINSKRVAGLRRRRLELLENDTLRPQLEGNAYERVQEAERVIGKLDGDVRTDVLGDIKHLRWELAGVAKERTKLKNLDQATLTTAQRNDLTEALRELEKAQEHLLGQVQTLKDKSTEALEAQSLQGGNAGAIKEATMRARSLTSGTQTQSEALLGAYTDSLTETRPQLPQGS
jgi:hypothetical protein